MDLQQQKQVWRFKRKFTVDIFKISLQNNYRGAFAPLFLLYTCFIARDTLLCITEYVILLRIGEILLLHLSIIRGNMDTLNGFM